MRGVLFDVDGTLVDTTFLHAVCWWDALRANEKHVPMANIHHAIGMGSDELLDHLLGEGRDKDDDETVIGAHLALYQQYWHRLQPLPGAGDLLRRCKSAGLTVVLASSASAEEFAALTAVLDADEAIDEGTTSDDADSAKPAPDVIQAALDRGKLDPEDVVFVGDAVWDGAACAKAGVQFIAVTCGGTPESDLRAAGPGERLSGFTTRGRRRRLTCRGAARRSADGAASLRASIR
jgi:HAD superfamily hydrolase (TIGR01509 family)